VQRLVTDYGFGVALRKAKKAFSSKAPNQPSEAVQEKQKIPQRLKSKTCLARCE
jgi:hypothetical protein